MSKINQLLQLQPQGVVLTTSWLIQQGYSYELLQKYRKSNWLHLIGNGAMVRSNDSVDYLGAIYSLQNQLNLNIHIGAKSALILVGKAHFIEFNTTSVYVFGNEKVQIPSWFKKYDWGVKLIHKKTSFLPSDIGLQELEVKGFSIKISSPIRALMECLYLSPEKQDIVECYELMKGLTNSAPKTIQVLLEKCNSVKVKRLFLYLAERVNHDWFNHLDISRINLGEGKRSISLKGKYIPKYKITVPKDIENNDLPEL